MSAARRRRPAPLTQDQRSEVERYLETTLRVPLIIPAEGAKLLIVKFNDYQCPACSASYLQYKPILAKYEAQYPGAIHVVFKDYPLNPNCNARSSMVHPGACDAAVAVRLAKLHNRGEAMEEWLYTHQEGMTPATVREAAREIGPGHRLRREVRVDARAGERRLRARQPARHQVDTHLLHERREDRRHVDAAILRSGDCLRTAPRDREVDEPQRPQVAALATFELTKDYAVGFWRKRPYRALDRLTLEVEPGEVFGFLGPNGAGKTTTLKLLMQLVFPPAGAPKSSAIRPATSA